MMNTVGFFVGMIFWITILVLTSFVLTSLWTKIFSGKTFQILMFPGIIIHELSHVLGCFLTGSKIEEVKFFSSKGGYVRHRKPKIPVIGMPIIGMFPVIGGIAFLFLLLNIFDFNFPETILFSGSLYKDFIELIRSSLFFITNHWGSWKFWLFLYLTVSVLICLIPSRQDLKNSLVGLIAIAVVLSLLINFNLFIEQVDIFINEYLTTSLIVGVFFGIIALIITVPIYLIKKLI